MPAVTGATLCFILSAGKTCLMLKRSREPHRGQWNAPGGKVLPGETPTQCCRREVLEETGLVFEGMQDMGFIDCVDAISAEITWRLFLFTGSHPETPVPRSGEGEFAWLPLDTVLAGGPEIVHNIPLILPLLLQNFPIRGSFEYRNDFLERYNICLTSRGKGLPI